MKEEIIKKIAMSIVEAEDDCKPIKKVSEQYDDLTIDDAYMIQKEVFKIKTSRGERIIGKKIGLTSQGIRKQIGVHEPDFSFITDRNFLPQYEKIKLSEQINPKLEPELAFLMNKDLNTDVVTNWQVIDAIEGIFPAFEIVDTRFGKYDFTIIDTISDSASYGKITVGNTIVGVKDVDLNNVGLNIYRDGELINTATSKEVMGNPINSVTWLANKMIELGSFIKKGDIILSGSFTPVLDIKSGEKYKADFSGIGSVEIEVE